MQFDYRPSSFPPWEVAGPGAEGSEEKRRSITVDDKKKALESILAAIEKALPPIVFRNWERWRDVIPISPRSVANDDSAGIGPKEKIYIGRVAGYPRAAFMDYLRSRSRLACCQKKEGVPHGVTANKDSST